MERLARVCGVVGVCWIAGGVVWSAPIVDLGAMPGLAPVMSPDGRVVGVLHSGEEGVSPRLVRWDSPWSPGVVQDTPVWLEPTRLSLGPDGAAVLSAWDTRGAWRELPHVQSESGGLVSLPHEGKFAGEVSLAAVAMGSDGAVFGFGRLDDADVPVAYDSMNELPRALPGVMPGLRVESGLVGADGSVVMSVSALGVEQPRTMRLDGEQWTDLGDPSATGADGWLVVRGGSSHGDLVGGGSAAPGEAMQPVLITPDGAIAALGLMDGWIGAEALAVNGAGWVVGEATVFDASSFELRGQAFAWHESVGLIELEGDGGWTLLSATGISDDGWVVGVGVLDGVERVYATRIPAPASVLLIGASAVWLRRRPRMIGR